MAEALVVSFTRDLVDFRVIYQAYFWVVSFINCHYVSKVPVRKCILRLHPSTRHKFKGIRNGVYVPTRRTERPNEHKPESLCRTLNQRGGRTLNQRGWVGRRGNGEEGGGWREGERGGERR